MTSSSCANIPYFISVGEQSGDLLAAELVSNLQKIAPQYKPYGVTGESMRHVGVASISDCKVLSVMGFVEVLKRLPELMRFETRILREIDLIKPAFAVLVDAPGFHFRLGKKLHEKGIKVIQYVAPQLWAWHESRVEKLKSDFDLVLGIMPFEEKFFKERGVNYVYIGTPHVERAKKAVSIRSEIEQRVEEKKAKIGLTRSGSYSQRPLLGFFPGSRIGEFSRIVPAMLKAAAIIDQKMVVNIVISKAPSLEDNLPFVFLKKLIDKKTSLSLKKTEFEDADFFPEETCVKLKNGSFLFFASDQSLRLMKSVDTALVTSGTATLECALCQTPLAVIYKTSLINYFIAKKLVKVPSISLVNLCAKKALVKEFVQAISFEELADEIIDLTTNGERRSGMKRDLSEMYESLSPFKPEMAAEAVLKRLRDF